MRLLALAGTVAVAVGIGLGSEGAADPRGAPSASTTPEVGCGKSGKGGQPVHGRDLIIGPVAFIGGIRRGGESVADSDDFEREPGQRYTGFKSGASVRRGTTVTIIVPRSQRPKLKLDYSPNHRPAFKNTLHGCNDRRAGFPGGFKVHGPLCTKLWVRVEGRRRPITKPVSFGAGECPAGSDTSPQHHRSGPVHTVGDQIHVHGRVTRLVAACLMEPRACGV